MKVKFAMEGMASAAASGWSAVWTFPAMLFSAFLITWGAEAAQFLIAQGLALAILAWIQTLPEFAVEAVIAWAAGGDTARCFVSLPPAGCHSHLAIANFTGAVRLLIGLGWPMIYFVAAFFRRRPERAFAPIVLEDQHAVEVLATVPPVLYFLWIWYKRSIGPLDAVILVAMYAAYLAVLWRFPAHGEESLADAPRVARWAYTRPGRWRVVAIAALFVGGGLLIYLTAQPFLDSMLAVATSVGISQFVFVQWVAPFVSEFPEKVSAFHWASRVSTAPTALMNLLSSNVNQWTVLAAMIPIVFSASRGMPASLRFDGVQRLEILLTVMQSLVAVLVLVRMRFDWWNASLLFGLWLAQFLEAHWRDEITWIYGIWAAVMVLSWIWAPPTAPRIFWQLVRERVWQPGA